MSCGHKAHEYADKIDEARISLAERRAALVKEECYEISVLQAASSAEELLYGPGIDESM